MENNETINLKDDKEMEEVKRAIQKVFNNDAGRLVLKYYKTIFRNSVDFDNTNKTYFNLGRLDAIFMIEKHLNYINNNINKNDQRRSYKNDR